MRNAECGVRNLREEWLRRCKSRRRPFGERQVRQGGLTSVICYSLWAPLISGRNRAFAGREGPRPAGGNAWQPGYGWRGDAGPDL